MAELNTSGGGGNKGGKVRSKKASTRVDLTAMVDLAFLLITFFILTTTLQKPKAMDLVMPDKDEKQPEVRLPVGESRTMTILLGANNKLEWFIGTVAKPKSSPVVDGYGRNGIRKALIEKGKEILASEGKEMMVLVVPSDKSTYNNLVTVMDELNIVGNTQRAIIDITNTDIQLLKRDGAY